MGSVSDSGDGVIELGSASGGIEDSTFVLREVVTGIDSDANWSLIKSSLELRSTLVLDSPVAGGCNDFLGLAGLAALSSALIWVG